MHVCVYAFVYVCVCTYYAAHKSWASITQILVAFTVAFVLHRIGHVVRASFHGALTETCGHRKGSLPGVKPDIRMSTMTLMARFHCPCRICIVCV